MADQKFVVFRLGEEKFGLPIERVEQILPIQDVTPIPKSPEMFLGVFDLRGQTIAVIDGRKRFGLPPAEDSHNLVIVAATEGRCAMQVDEVVGIVVFDEKSIDRDTAFFDDKKDPFFAGIGKSGNQLTVLLDPDHVVPAGIVPDSVKNRQAAA